MLPTEQYSGDAVPQVPWTPPVWQSGPDGLVAEAKQEMWSNYTDVTRDILGSASGGDSSAMSGGSPQGKDDGEYYQHPGDGPDSRAADWNNQLQEMRKN